MSMKLGADAGQGKPIMFNDPSCCFYTLDSPRNSLRFTGFSYQSWKLRVHIKLFVLLLLFCSPVSLESGNSGNKTLVVAVAGDNQAFNSRPQVLGV
jgi:hypothetical protein